MDRSLEEYGAGSGLVIGAGIGGTAAVTTGLETSLAVVAGLGVAGGLVIGTRRSLRRGRRRTTALDDPPRGPHDQRRPPRR
jgi:hypothetical protein